jgi:hypothetical protein
MSKYTTVSNLPPRDPRAPYLPSDYDDAGATKYYGFLANDGRWYIMRDDTAAKTWRYIAGNGGYATNWTGRAGLTYDYADVIFKKI